MPVSEKRNLSLDRPVRKRSEDFKRNATTVQIVSVVQRNREMFLRYTKRFTKRFTKEQIEQALEGRIAENTTLITDKHPFYKAFSKANPTIKHKRLLAKDYVDKNDKSIHLQKSIIHIIN